jgi:hypothetical protein
MTDIPTADKNELVRFGATSADGVVKSILRRQAKRQAMTAVDRLFSFSASRSRPEIHGQFRRGIRGDGIEVLRTPFRAPAGERGGGAVRPDRPLQVDWLLVLDGESISRVLRP